MTMKKKMKEPALVSMLAAIFLMAACASYTSTPDVAEGGEAEGAGAASSSAGNRDDSPPRASRVEVPAGTTIDLETMTTLSSGTSQVGDPLRARVVSDVVAGNAVAIPAGTQVSGSVTGVRSLKKFGGQPQIAFSFDEVQLPTGTVPIRTYVQESGKKQKGRDAAKIGAGAAAGAVLGHQVDDDQGRLIGAIVGGAVGTAVAATTGKEVELPAGTLVTVRIEESVDVPITR